jgi:hypothetical protein
MLWATLSGWRFVAAEGMGKLSRSRQWVLKALPFQPQAHALATCPFSELGFLRVSTHPKALKADMATARQLLKAFIEKNRVEFVPASLPALQSKPARSEEVADFYLAELAAKNQMKLATLDRNILHPAVEVIAPASPEVPPP